jgi:hypothetical protein
MRSPSQCVGSSILLAVWRRWGCAAGWRREGMTRRLAAGHIGIGRDEMTAARIAPARIAWS